MKEFFFHSEVKPEFIDRYGHMNNTHYLTLYEKARWAMGDETGVYTGNEVDRTKIGPIILEIQIKFKKELKAGMRLTIKTVPREFKRAFLFLDQYMYGTTSIGEELLCSTAVFMMALFDMNERKILSPPDRWKEALGFPTV